jgi:putative polyhydroxyalkanoate system protein
VAEIHIRRGHQLGLARAREIATDWVRDGALRFDLQCEQFEESDRTQVRFRRTGVEGTLIATSDQFELRARLGVLLGAFSKAIEADIGRQLDQLLGPAPD